MRFLLLSLGFIVAMYSCDSSKAIVKGDPGEVNVAQSDTVRIANEALEYEIIIIEPGFNSWLITQFPREYYSIGFLENKNAFFVSAYNRRVTDGRFSRELYSQFINYEPSVRYGKEVNYLLYNYFVYFEQTFGQKLL